MLHISWKIYGAINAQGLRFRALVVFNPVPTTADGVTVTDVADSDVVIAAADAVTIPKLWGGLGHVGAVVTLRHRRRRSLTVI